MKGRLSDLRKKEKQLDCDASGRIALIRQILDPYEDDVTRIAVDQAALEAKKLEEIVTELRDTRIKIDRLERDLE